MTLTLQQSATAVGPNGVASFIGIGGTGSLSYTVLPGGAGGAIDSSGNYQAPSTLSSSPSQFTDTVQVTDGAAQTATATIAVGNALLLLCDIIQRELSLANGRVYLWDQKIMQPTDSGLYVAVSVPYCKAFASTNRPAVTEGGLDQDAFVSMFARVDIDIISRGTEARDRKEEVILALKSDYAQRQQTSNGFYIATLATGFLNLSNLDGAAIPYRYKITVNMQYAYARTKASEFYDQFSDVELTTNP